MHNENENTCVFIYVYIHINMYMNTMYNVYVIARPTCINLV